MAGPLQNPFMFKSASGASNFYTHQIAHSCRFKSATSDALSLTFGTSTDLSKFTFSCWVKRSLTHSNGGNTNWQNIIGNTTGVDGGGAAFGFESGGGTSGGLNNRDRIAWYGLAGAGGGNNGGDDRIAGYFYDTSAWYHIVVRVDTGQNAATKIRYYVNGDLKARTATNEPTGNMSRFNTATAHYIGALANGNYDLDGYLAEVVFCDGQSLGPDSFGETKNGAWIPSDPSGLTFGTNGFYLKFADSGALGKDSSGNDNDWTVVNLAAHDQMLDSPTFGSSSSGNFCTMNPLSTTTQSSVTALEGNLFLDGSTTNPSNYEGGQLATMGVRSGKWYWEVYLSGGGAATTDRGWTNGIAATGNLGEISGTYGPYAGGPQGNSYNFGSYGGQGIRFNDSTTSYGAGPANTNIIGMALDLSSPGSGSLTIYINNSSQGVAVNGSIADAHWVPFVGAGGGSVSAYDSTVNFGQDSTFAGVKSAGGNADANGHGDFFYAPPSGHLAICTGNLPVADSIDPAQTDDDFPQKLFSPLLYVGNGSDDRNITGVGFAPDWVWMKSRTDAEGHQNWDTSRGVEKRLQQNSSGAEESTSDKFQAFQSDGFQVGSSNDTNKSSSNFVTWNWRANGGTTASGSGNLTSTQQVDPSGGFSIVKAVGDGGSGDKTISHGLSAAPTCIIAKNLDAAYNWDTFWSEGLTATSYSLRLNTTDAQLSGRWSTVNSSIFTCKENYTWAGTNNFIYYCFTNIEGYIKSGSYVANGTADNAFVYLGFRPAFLLVKGVVSGAAWTLIDNKRDGFNPTPSSLEPNSAAGTYTTAAPFADLLSNGFKVRTANAVMGSTSYDPYVYLAIAENPFKYALAR